MNNYKVPSSKDWSDLESYFQCKFCDEFKLFIELMSEYCFPGDILNVNSVNNNGNDTIILVYNFEMENGEWRKEFIPFYSIGNGEYFCLNKDECPDSKVYYYIHEINDVEIEEESFEDWIKKLPEFLS